MAGNVAVMLLLRCSQGSQLLRRLLPPLPHPPTETHATLSKVFAHRLPRSHRLHLLAPNRSCRRVQTAPLPSISRRCTPPSSSNLETLMNGLRWGAVTTCCAGRPGRGLWESRRLLPLSRRPALREGRSGSSRDGLPRSCTPRSWYVFENALRCVFSLLHRA